MQAAPTPIVIKPGQAPPRPSPRHILEGGRWRPMTDAEAVYLAGVPLPIGDDR